MANLFGWVLDIYDHIWFWPTISNWVIDRERREEMQKMQMHRQSRETIHYSLMVKVKEKEKQRVIDALKSLEFLKMDQEIVHGKILVELDEVIKTIKDMAERLKIIVP